VHLSIVFSLFLSLSPFFYSYLLAKGQLFGLSADSRGQTGTNANGLADILSRYIGTRGDHTSRITIIFTRATRLSACRH